MYWFFTYISLYKQEHKFFNWYEFKILKIGTFVKNFLFSLKFAFVDSSTIFLKMFLSNINNSHWDKERIVPLLGALCNNANSPKESPFVNFFIILKSIISSTIPFLII